MNNKPAIFLSVVIVMLVALGVGVNVQEQMSIDRTKLPEKVELSKGFQKWITNLKNKDFTIEADEFRLKEDNEIYNTKWIKIYSLDESGKQDELEATLTAHRDLPHVVFSPSERIFIDYRNIPRDGYTADEARLYGQMEDKIMDARILNCEAKANCYFDRAYFLENDIFVISEVSRTIEKDDAVITECTPDQECEYSFKVHMIDLKNNKRYIYESKPFNGILTTMKSEL